MSDKKEHCSRCGGSGYYYYDNNHTKPCEQCCKHDMGWWELSPHHAGYIADADNGCCSLGCGQLRRDIQGEKEPEVELGDGWWFLRDNELMKAGDEFCGFYSFIWQEIPDHWIGKACALTRSRIRRRAAAKPEPMGLLFYEWRVNDSNKAVLQIDMERAEFNNEQARRLIEWLSRYVDWSEEQDRNERDRPR